jgi:hypothetical protein
MFDTETYTKENYESMLEVVTKIQNFTTREEVVCLFTDLHLLALDNMHSSSKYFNVLCMINSANKALEFFNNNKSVIEEYKEYLNTHKENLSKSYSELYKEGLLSTYYQPKEEYFPDTMYSFEVYGNLEIGISEQGIPKEHWLEFTISTIEDPVFLD